MHKKGRKIRRAKLTLLRKSFILFLSIGTSLGMCAMDLQIAKKAKTEELAVDQLSPAVLDVMQKNIFVGEFKDWGFYKYLTTAQATPLRQELILKGLKQFFSPLELRTFLQLCESYDVQRIFLQNEEIGYSLIIDLFYWVKNKNDTFKNLANLADVKAIFERERAVKSLDIVSGNNGCALPESVAIFFPFLNSVVSGNYAESNPRKITLVGDLSQETLLLFKRLLIIIYNYHQMFPSEKPHEEVRWNLVYYLTDYIQEYSQKNENDMTELLFLAHRYDIKVILAALVHLYNHSFGRGATDEERTALAASIPVEYFPALCGYNRDYFILQLLGIKLGQIAVDADARKDHVREIVDACVDSFVNDIHSYAENDFNDPALLSSLQKQIKRKILDRYHITNFYTVWRDVPKARTKPVQYFKINNDFHETSACFVGFDNTVLMVTDENANHNDPEVTYRDTEKYTHVAVFAPGLSPDDHLLYAGALPSGEILIKTTAANQAPVVIKSDESWGQIKALAGSFSPAKKPLLAVSYTSGAVELFDAATREHLGEIAMAKNDGIYIHHISFGGNMITASTNGVIRIYDGQDLKTTITLPQLTANRELISGIEECLEGGFLAVSTKTGVVYIIDKESGKCMRTLTPPKGKHHNCEVTAIDSYKHFLAVAYGEAGVYIYDPIEGTCVKRIERACDGVKAIGLEFHYDRLQIFYDDWVQNHHIVFECAPLEGLLSKLITEYHRTGW